jgi:flagellar basal body-associated protein FliL
MKNFRTHYDNLKIARTAPDSIIRAAYKTLMQQYHPDKFEGHEAEALRIAKIIKKSYEVLIDPISRAEHDHWIDEQLKKEANTKEFEGKSNDNNSFYEYRYDEAPPNSSTTEKNNFSNKSNKSILWRRFFARNFDLWWETFLVAFFLGYVFSLSFPGFNDWLLKPGSNIVFGFFCVPFAFILDATVHYMFGNTPGKLWLCLTVSRNNGDQLNFNDLLVRNISIWITGMAFGLPLICLIPMTYQAYKVKNGNDASYDRVRQFKVTGSDCSWIRKLFFTFVFLLFLIVISILNSLSKSSITKSNDESRNELIQTTYASCHDEMLNKNTENSFSSENIENYCKCYSQEVVRNITTRDIMELSTLSYENSAFSSELQQKITSASEICMNTEINRVASIRKSNISTYPPSDSALYYFEDYANPYLVNFPPGSSMTIIKVNLAMLVEGKDDLDLIKQNYSMIRNNILIAISMIGPDKLQTANGKKELRELILYEIGVISKRISQRNLVKNIYYTDFIMQ